MKKVIAPLLLALLAATQAQAELNEIVLSKQYGLGYLPFIVLEEKQLIEKHAKEAGLEVKTTWTTFGGGAAANDALLSGQAQVVSGGVAPFIRLWDKTGGSVKALFALNEEPVIFASSNPAVKTVADLSSKDKIGLPATTVSIQAFMLQFAAAQALGIENYNKLDQYTVTMKNPDGYVALTSGTEVNGHISREPYSTLELQQPNIHQVFNSYDLFGGKHTAGLAWTTEKFYQENPKLAKAIVAAEKEAVDWITNNPDDALKLYFSAYKSDESPELLKKLLRDTVSFDIRPTENITKFSDFLHDVGVTKRKAQNWQELFFDAVH